LFVCLCVCFLSNRKGRTLRRPTWFHLVQPSPHIGCSADIGTPDEVILPTTNTPRYSRFDPNRPDPNPIEDKVKSTSWPFPNKRSQACHLAITMSQIVMCSKIPPDKKWCLESNQGPIANVYRRMLDQLSYSRLVLRTARRQLLCLAKKLNLLCSICMLHVEGQSRNLL